MTDTQENSSRKKKRKLKPIPVIILAVILVTTVASLLWVFRAKPKDESVNISISGVGGTTKNSDINESNPAIKETTISIDMDSCAIPIGTSIKVTASIDPSAEVEKSINWSSSDKNVFTVDSEGIITVKGKGTSALTATLGNSSDAIVIEGIANDDSAKSQNNLPIFNLITGGSASTKGTSNNGTSSNGTSSNGTASNGTSSKNITTNNSGDAVNTNNSGNTDNLNNLDNNTSNTGNTSNTENSGNTGNTGNTDDSNNQTNSGLKSTDLYQSLSQIGYVQRLTNVYVYEENNTYYGEIIIQSNVTIIYIKQRCDGYDAKIKEVITKLIPTENSEVWNNYISASSDRTFTAEGRMVRIVTALNGGHSQIVIYN